MKKNVLLGLLVLLGFACSRDSLNENLQTVDLKGSKEKIELCHNDETSGTHKIIEVPEEAVESHLAHGDVRLDDEDGDGYLPYNECGVGGDIYDCDDTNPHLNPSSIEFCGNGIDDDCDGKIDNEDPQGCIGIGSEYVGGVIAYFFKAGDPGYVDGEVHGIIAAKSDLEGLYGWGCYGKNISGAESSAILGGLSNTNDITNNCNDASYAAKAANESELNGYNDWVLPSIGELLILNKNKDRIGGFDSGLDVFYWSSTENSTSPKNAAYRTRFRTSSETASSDIKTRTYKVRIIRYF